MKYSLALIAVSAFIVSFKNIQTFSKFYFANCSFAFQSLTLASPIAEPEPEAIAYPEPKALAEPEALAEPKPLADPEAGKSNCCTEKVRFCRPKKECCCRTRKGCKRECCC